ncbi:MAG: hypothetical protein DWQ01_18580 [Planctomycetota bacterium]|nr:MAG: hypothetical protein DWQ01_18580 [Planctomycetota bacterium]
MLGAAIAVGGPAVLATSSASSAADRLEPAVASMQEQEPSLEEAMTAMKKSLRKLRRGLPKDDVDMAAMVEHVLDAQAYAQISRLMQPHYAEKIPEAQRKTYLQEYRIMQLQMIQKMFDLEIALVKEDREAAQKVLAEVLAFEKAGHEKFNVE